MKQIPDEQRCVAIVYLRDTYRYTGRGRNGFEMYYSKERCKRRATVGDMCWQHAFQKQRRMNVQSTL